MWGGGCECGVVDVGVGRCGENMPQLNNFFQAWKRLEHLTPMLPLPSFVSVEVSVNLSIWLISHLLYMPQRPAVDTSDRA